MKAKITKTNANGNSFIIIKEQNLDNKFLDKKFIKKICEHYSTDGLITINFNNKNKAIMNYFNNDGTWETLCINGLTCSSLFLKPKLSQKELYIESNNILYPIEIQDNNQIKIKLPVPYYKEKNITLNKIQGAYINSGAKHFVIELKEWPNNNDLILLAKKIRYNKEIFPNGTNVNFFKILNKSSIEVKTYEKGVEKLMDSCASGSYACAYDCYINKKVDNQISIINPGGEFHITLNNDTMNYYIINTAVLEYDDIIDLSLYL